MKHGMVCDHDDLFWVGDSHTSPRERANNLLSKIVPKCGQFGHYLLYMCIRDSAGNPLGHGDAVRELTAYGMHTLQVSWVYAVCMGPTLFLFLNHQVFSFQECMMIGIPSQQKQCHHAFLGLWRVLGQSHFREVPSFPCQMSDCNTYHCNMLCLDSIVVW